MVKRFYYTEDIVRVSGFQRSYVVAESLEEAKKLIPKSIFDYEEVEVRELGEPQWEDERRCRGD